MIAGQFRIAAGAGKGRGGALRCQGKSLDAAGSLAPGIVVNAHKNGIGHAVGNSHALLQGQEIIRIAGHHHAVALLLQHTAQLAGNSQIQILFLGIGTHRTGIVPAVTGVEHYCAQFIFRRKPRAQHRIHQLAHIDRRNHELLPQLAHRMRKHIAEIVHVEIMLPGLDGDHMLPPAVGNTTRPTLFRGKTVEAPHIAQLHIINTINFIHLPHPLGTHHPRQAHYQSQQQGQQTDGIFSHVMTQ